MTKTVEIKRNTKVPILHEWIHNHMKKVKVDETRNFNMFAYSKAERDEAIEKLNNSGYTTEVEGPGGNSLKVGFIN